MDPIPLARHLRNNPTPEELALWHALSRVRPRFTRQLRIGPYVADFACRRARTLVEVDGSQHADSTPDEQRTGVLESHGWRVLRVWNSDVQENLEGLVQALLLAAGERLPPGEHFEFTASRAGRERRPRTRKK
jgi:very-short-patch-repair endonuclease